MKQSFTIPDGCTTVTVEQIENKLIATFEAKFEPKDGDFVKSPYNGIGIFQKRNNEDNCIVYCYINKNRGLSVYENDSRCNYNALTLATESEKQQLLDALAKDGKKWNAELKRVEKLRWRAGEGEKYFVCREGGITHAYIESFDDNDDRFFETGNYFQTRRQSQTAADRINAIFAENL